MAGQDAAAPYALQELLSVLQLAAAYVINAIRGRGVKQAEADALRQAIKRVTPALDALNPLSPVAVVSVAPAEGSNFASKTVQAI